MGDDFTISQMLGLPKSKEFPLLSLFGGVFDSLCNTGKAHFFSEPQFPYVLGLLLLASLLQRVTEWVGLDCGAVGVRVSDAQGLSLPPPCTLSPPPPAPRRSRQSFLSHSAPSIGELGRRGAGCRRSLLHHPEVS